MTSVKSLCTNCLLLQKGVIQKSGSVGDVIDFYLNPPKEERLINIPENIERYGTGEAIYKSFYLTNEENQIIDKVYYLQPFFLNFEFEVKKILDHFHQFVFWVQIADSQGTIISMSSSIDDGSEPLKFGIGSHKIKSKININLIPGTYIINIAISNMKGNIDNLTNIYGFEVSEVAEDSSKSYPWGIYRPGFIVPDSKWLY
jgi:hypothetical protein